MVKVDLITGFLGSGKTTFLRRYAKYLLAQGLHIGIIENDFGAVNVDRLLLQDLEGERCEIEQIVGGNVAEDWRRRFKAKLIALSMCGVERVVVEPSGIYDTDTFFDVLYEEPIASLCEAGSIIAIVDAADSAALPPQAEYLLMAQVARCGCVLLSKIDAAGTAQAAEARLAALLKKYDCTRDICSCILVKPWDKLTDEDYRRLAGCGWARAGYQSLRFDENEVFTSQYFLNIDMPRENIRLCISQLFADGQFGKIFRCKGFFAVDGSWLEVNATAEQLELKPSAAGQKAVIVIGEGLNRPAIERHFALFAAK